MNVAVVYILPHVNLVRYLPLARRFAESYRRFPPGYPHHLHVVVNGSVAVEGVHQSPFIGLEADFITGNNVGRDIGAYQQFAARHPEDVDLMVCLGTPVHCCCSNWLDRMVEAYCERGPGIYGSYAFHHPAYHVRTTNFWISPHLFNVYPFDVRDSDRYAFEWGKSQSITRLMINLGQQAVLVTRTESFTPAEWRHVTNAEALMLDQHTDRIGYH